MLTLFLISCTSDPAHTGSPPAVPPEESDTDTDTDTDADADADTDADTDADAGLLHIEQIQVSGEGIGEAALIIGPDGTTVLLDVAGESHTDAVLEALDHHLGERAVDWVVLTHWHRDHVGGFAGLFGGSTPEVAVREAIVTRGLVDIDSRAAHSDATTTACAALAETTVAHVPLCAAPELADCELSGAAMPWPARDCDDLLLGDLSDATDDGDGRLSHISLGDGAALAVYWVNGWLAADGGVIDCAAEGVTLGHDHFNQENARSMGGFIRYGDFLYLFGGDLTGAGAGSPSVEQLIVDHAPSITDGGATAMPAGQVDVIHINHHGHNTATSQAWVDWAMPDDGQPRSAVVGANQYYLGAVDQVVLDRLNARTAGGDIWITEDGGASNTPKTERIVDASVLLTVEPGGERYRIEARDGERLTEAVEYQSTNASQ